MRTQRTAALAADINVTPLVDVCLVLLIIFMVTLPMLVNGIPIKLPEVANGDSTDKRLLPITIKEDGSVYLDTLIVRADEVPSALQRLRETAASRPVGVRADKHVPYGEVITVLDACRKAGWEDVTLIAARKDGNG